MRLHIKYAAETLDTSHRSRYCNRFPHAHALNDAEQVRANHSPASAATPASVGA